MKKLTKVSIALATIVGLTACGGGDGGDTLAQNASPHAKFTTSCDEFNCNFTNSSTDSDGTITSYAWDFGDNSTASDANVSHTYSGYGSYQAKLTVTDNSGANGSKTQTVSILIDVHAQQATINMFDDSIVFSQDFNHRGDGLYSGEQMVEDFDCNPEVYDASESCNPPYFNVDEVAIQASELKVTLSEGMIGSGIDMLKPLGTNYNELYLTFTLRFDENYDTVAKGGKLMGLGGKDDYAYPPTGCITVGPDEGFSTRYMYRQQGQFMQYTYHQDKTEVCGETAYISNPSEIDGFKFKKDQTYVVEMHTKMNDIGQANGVFETSINGIPVMSNTNFVFSESGTYGINTFLFQLYIGGQEDDWKLNNPSTLYLDNFVLSTSSVVTAL